MGETVIGDDGAGGLVVSIHVPVSELPGHTAQPAAAAEAGTAGAQPEATQPGEEPAEPIGAESVDESAQGGQQTGPPFEPPAEQTP